MDERRAAVRKRVLYGAVATTPSDGRRYDCVVKNWSDLGACIEFREPVTFAEDFALILTKTGASYRARAVWSRGNAVGLAFTSAPAATYMPDDALDNQMRDTKEAARLLTKVVDQVLGT